MGYRFLSQEWIAFADINCCFGTSVKECCQPNFSIVVKGRVEIGIGQ
jgi:hypothetical protein